MSNNFSIVFLYVIFLLFVIIICILTTFFSSAPAKGLHVLFVLFVSIMLCVIYILSISLQEQIVQSLKAAG